MKWFLGLLVILLGAVMVIKTPWFVSNFGRSSWAEQHLGGGGTYLMYKLLGIIMILATLMVVTGLMGELFLSIFGRLFGL